MLILVVGAKGGIGTTSMALDLVRGLDAVGLDMAGDRELAAQLGRRAWTLARIVFAMPGQRRRAIDTVVDNRPVLLWTQECALKPSTTAEFIQAVADRDDVVVDGGIRPRQEIAEIADQVIIVTDDDDPVARYHAQKLKKRYSGSLVVSYDRETVQELIEEISYQREF